MNETVRRQESDLFTGDGATVRPDGAKWLLAADKEIKDLKAKGTWVEVKKFTATKKILPNKWVMKQKRNTKLLNPIKNKRNIDRCS